jgi:hypothetical protein
MVKSLNLAANDKRTTGYNNSLAIGGMKGFLPTEVQNSTFILWLNFWAKNPAHRKVLKRYVHNAKWTHLKLQRIIFDT